MIRYTIRRLIGMIVVLIVVSFITFALFYMVPTWLGIHVVSYYVPKLPPDAKGLAALEHRLGFDRPWYVQYGDFMKGIVAGRKIPDSTSGTLIQCDAPCFGNSIRQKVSVNSLLLRALPVSFSLVVGAAILWLIIGITVGTLSGTRPGSWLDRSGMGLSLAAVSLPIFFTGPILLFIFSYKLGWLKNVHYVSITDNPISWARNLILAWVALAFLFAALYARLTRANMLEVMGEDYIRTARAKGLPEGKVVIKHGLRSALTPIVTIFGIDLGTLIGSTVITERVFNLRGLGTLSIVSIDQRDMPIILAVTIVAALFVVVANFLVDLLYGVVDPRVSYS